MPTYLGCGLGCFSSKLARRARIVDAIEADQQTMIRALEIHNRDNIYYQCSDFLNADLQHNSYDAIVLIASPHHMDLGKGSCD